MPELPDLQVFSKNLKKRIADKKIVSADIFNRTKLNITADAAQEKLLVTRIADIVRE